MNEAKIARIRQINQQIHGDEKSLEILVRNGAFKSLKERVMKFLLSNAKNGVVQSIQENIANHIGSAREAVAKVLKELKEEGIIATKRGEIVIKGDLDF